MKFFVTGATGFVGGALAKELRKAGHTVHASVRNMEKTAELETLGIRLFKGDVTDKESMREAMTGVDGVYHLAGWYKIGAKDKSLGEKVNIQGTRNVLELMHELKIQKGVYTSTCGVNSDTKSKVVDESYRFSGNHISEYDRTKAVAHDIANSFIEKGLPLVIVMPDVIYGHGDTSSFRTSLIQFLVGRLPILPSQTGICLGHIDDTVQGHILAMEKGKSGETYIIAGEPYRLIDVFREIAKISRIPKPFAFPYQLMKILSFLLRPFDDILPDSLTSENLRVLAGVTYWGDNSKAKRELGFNPRPMHEGLPEIVKYEMQLLGMK